MLMLSLYSFEMGLLLLVAYSAVTWRINWRFFFAWRNGFVISSSFAVTPQNHESLSENMVAATSLRMADG